MPASEPLPPATTGVPTPGPQRKYRSLRNLTQVLGLVALVVIPALGIFRMDFARGSLLLLGQDVGLRDFSAMAGLAIVFAAAPLVTYSTIGTVWCGWACPQNTLSEWATRLTHRMLGRRANVSVESDGLVVAPSKNRIVNWALLVASVLGVSLLLGAIPMFWFLPPGELLSLVQFRADPEFARFMGRLYFVFVLAVVVDVAVFRHFWCDYLCPYRFGMLLFRTDEGLHVHYDASRSDDCAKCNLCSTVCITRIEPTKIGRFDRCIDCGDCIDACEQLHRKRGNPPGLLRFGVGREHRTQKLGEFLLAAQGRVGIPGLLTGLGVAMIAWGLYSR